MKKPRKVLEVEGCRSSVVRALVAEARCPGLNSLATHILPLCCWIVPLAATTKIFFHILPLLDSFLSEKVSI